MLETMILMMTVTLLYIGFMQYQFKRVKVRTKDYLISRRID